jgi:hypothetical protein
MAIKFEDNEYAGYYILAYRLDLEHVGSHGKLQEIKYKDFKDLLNVC